MAHLARLIAFFLAVFACLPTWGYGSVNKKSYPVYYCPGGGGFTVDGAPYTGVGRYALSACGQYVSGTSPFTSTSGNVTTRTLLGCSGLTCQMQSQTVVKGCTSCTSTSTVSITAAWKRDELGCPDNATAVPGKTICQCNASFKPDGNGECVPLQCPVAGNYSAMTQPDQAVKNAGDSLCMGGCGYTPTGYKVGQDGTIWAGWPFKSTGKTCTGLPDPVSGATSGEENTSNPAPVPCGANQCPGSVTVGGVTTQMCVACKGTSAPPTTEAASAPAGSASGTGDVTKTTQTTCDGTTCTTTTTTKDSTGTVVGSTEKKEAQENFCQQNPQSQLCKKSSFGGSCAATTCDGDAVQCALAQDVIKRNCQFYDDSNWKSAISAADSARTAGDKPSFHPGASANVVSTSMGGKISQVDLLPGSCPADQSFTLFGSVTASLPFSKICGPLELVGKAMVALSMLVAALIIFKG